MSNNIADIFEDLVTLDEFAKCIPPEGKSRRTVHRWTQGTDGLPTLKIGNTPYVHLPTGREWVLSRMRTPNPRRRPKVRRPSAATLARCESK
jgi:hypothetical protein